ncbi:MAG: aminoacetone oxidase family FAD-binding enzyme [Oscillospiraceae bacterium]|jgi:predicted Rossmann fold flavoprotein|nr:aminoacetone oxidase family FAD-binding enzyme [Oscillospiraceae bacterium]
MKTYKMVIIGAGASGLAAAIAAGRRSGDILLLERLPRVGKKILATGNGRCNLSNQNVLDHPYHNKRFVLPALRMFGAQACESFFASLGAAIYADGEGRFYPNSNSASTVLDALRFGVARAGVETRCDCAVQSIEKQNGGYLINQNIRGERVVIATGGCAAPAHGSDGSGFALLKSLGHKIITPRPALAGLLSDCTALPALAGQRVRCGAVLKTGGGTILAASAGEVLFAKDGVSGIAAMELSRSAAMPCILFLDCLPNIAHAQAIAFLCASANACPELTASVLLGGLLPKRLAETILRQCNQDLHAQAAAIVKKIPNFVDSAKSFRIPITGTRGFKDAQSTAGGADVSMFDPLTMQSKLRQGLFACGEVLDVDGGCGGFSLHWAWASGVLAGARAISST